jgi:hypothetical protein
MSIKRKKTIMVGIWQIDIVDLIFNRFKILSSEFRPSFKRPPLFVAALIASKFFLVLNNSCAACTLFEYPRLRIADLT